MGSFRPGAGNQHLHWSFNFTGCIVATALKSLRLSCGSEPVSYTHLAVVGPKGWAVRPLKRYASWVQNVVRQFGPYPAWA